MAWRFTATSELPPGFVCGWRYRAPVIAMPVYLDYLVARLERAGVTVDVNPITSLTEVKAVPMGHSRRR